MVMVDTLTAVINLVNRAGALHWDFASAMFVQVVALVAVLGVVELCLRSRVRPVVRYWLWALVILKLMLPVTLSTPASVAYWVVKEPAPVASTSIAPTIEIAPATTSAPAEPPITTDIEQPPPELWGKSPKVALNPPIESPSPPRLATRGSPERPASVTTRKQRPSLTASGWLFLAWCGGCLVLGVIVLRRTAKVRQLVRRAAEAPGQLAAPMQVACELLDLSSRRVRLRISDEVGCPAICGLWRPTILIPRRLVGQLDDEQFELVFVHELSHWKRWDLQINLLQTVLQIVYFYNPAVWFANAVLRRLREEAVDDAVLIAAGTPRERYSNTLLDVASQSLQPLEMSLRLIGILETRKALAQRIHRMAISTLPRSARLGLWGFVAVGVAAIGLLPMSGRRASFAAFPIDPSAIASNDASTPARPSDSPTKSSAAGGEARHEGRAGESIQLSGRITDENGAPVADARINIFPKGGGRVDTAHAQADGSYAFKRIQRAGVYDINVFSSRCIGLTDQDDNRVVSLDPAKQATRDFVLNLACQARIQVVDEQGRPLRGVVFYKPGRYDGQDFRTDKRGQVTIGGLSPSPMVRRFAAYHKDFAIVPLDIKLDDPKKVVERKLTLAKGVSVRGVVMCSDGKPASGWTILTLPSWWNFMASPNGEPIKQNGSFELPHVGPGTYKISVSIPQGGGMAVAPVVMSDVDLVNRKEPLKIKVDFPSPASMGFIEGRIRFVGGRPKQGFWVHAFARGTSFGGGQYLQPGEESLKLGPMPAGNYRLQVNSREIELKDMPPVVTGTKDLLLELNVRGQMRLKGVIAGGDTSHALKNPRVRLIKTQTLRGPNYSAGRNWSNVDDPNGRFTVELAGPGVYVVEATADGYSIARSESVNSDLQLNQEVHLKLSKGITLFGTVVDEAGRPINGATVLALSKVAGPLPVTASELSPGAGVRTVEGRFQFDDLNPGKETLRAVHPDYAFRAIEDLDLKADGKPSPLTIVMRRGGTVRGHVFDEFGRPAAGVPLHFQDRNSYVGGEWENKGRFATVLTDQSGYYEASHLPDELIYIRREQEWESLGVVRQTVLPPAGRPATVDFGGPAKVTGRLLINGSPAANRKVLLSGENPNFAIMKVYALTDQDGRFLFRGIAPGERYLYAAGPGGPNDWIRIRPLLLDASNKDFGTIDHVTVTLTVRWQGPKDAANDDANVTLRYYDPVWFGLELAGLAAPRPGMNEPFVFRNLPVGKYALTTFQRGKLGVRQVVEITGAQHEQSIMLPSPLGTAAVRGTIDVALCGPGGCNSIQLRSSDNRLQGILDVKPDGKFEFAGLPAGDYFLTQQAIVNADALAVFTVADGETKSISVAGKLLGWRQLPRGFLQIRPYTVDGLPLPGCHVTLTGPKGEIDRNGSQNGQVTFISNPGVYQLAVTYPGFKSVARQVEMKSTQDGRWSARDNVLNVRLIPLD
jgi:beta-lactamase regulating signal transducer with metallopeptidase domain/protocatechuate 3,4-dioxygenase beta subunit